MILLSICLMGIQLASDYKEVFKAHEVTSTVISNLSLPYTNQQLLNMLTLTNPAGTRILDIAITSANPEEAAAIANEFMEVASQYVADVMITDKPTVLSTALVPSKPVGPSLPKNVVIGAMVGLMIACAYFTLLFVLDDKVKSSEDITKLTGLPVLAEIPLFTSNDVLQNAEKKALAGRNGK